MNQDTVFLSIQFLEHPLIQASFIIQCSLSMLISDPNLIEVCIAFLSISVYQYIIWFVFFLRSFKVCFLKPGCKILRYFRWTTSRSVPMCLQPLGPARWSHVLGHTFWYLMQVKPFNMTWQFKVGYCSLVFALVLLHLVCCFSFG